MGIRAAKYSAVYSEDEIAEKVSSESRKMRKCILWRRVFAVYTPIKFGGECPCEKFGLYEFTSGKETAIPGCKIVWLTYFPVFPEQVKRGIENFKSKERK